MALAPVADVVQGETLVNVNTAPSVVEQHEASGAAAGVRACKISFQLHTYLHLTRVEGERSDYYLLKLPT